MRLVPNLFAGRPAVAEYDFSGIVMDANGSHWSNGDAVYGMIRPCKYSLTTTIFPLTSLRYQSMHSDLTKALFPNTPSPTRLCSPHAHICLPRPPQKLPASPPSRSRPTNASSTSHASSPARLSLLTAAAPPSARTQFSSRRPSAHDASSRALPGRTGTTCSGSARTRCASRAHLSSTLLIPRASSSPRDQFIDYTATDIATALAANPPAGRFNVVFDAAGLTDSSLYAKSPAYLAPGGMFVTVGPQPTSWRDVPRLCMLMFHLVRPVWLGGVDRKWKYVRSLPGVMIVSYIQGFDLGCATVG